MYYLFVKLLVLRKKQSVKLKYFFIRDKSVLKVKKIKFTNVYIINFLNKNKFT